MQLNNLKSFTHTNHITRIFLCDKDTASKLIKTCIVHTVMYHPTKTVLCFNELDLMHPSMKEWIEYNSHAKHMCGNFLSSMYAFFQMVQKAMPHVIVHWNQQMVPQRSY